MSGYYQNAQHYRNINQLTLSISKLDSEESIYWEIAEQCAALLNLADCVIYKPEPLTGKFIQVAAYGAKKEGDQILKPITLDFGEGIVGSCAKARKTIIVEDLTLDPRYVKDEFEARSEISVPVIFNDKLFGIIDSESDVVGFYHEEHKDFLEAIASISALKIAELNNLKEVVEHEQYLNQILESPKGLFAYSLDRDYRYKTFNQNHARMIKDHYGIEAKVGLKVLEIVKDPEEQKYFWDSFERAMAGEEHMIFEEFESASGRPVQYLEKFYSPLYSSGGDIMGISVFIRDVTDVKKAQDKLHEREHLIKAINENLKEGIFRYSIKNGFVYSNHALSDLFGMEYPGEKFIDFESLHAEPDGHEKLFEEILKKGTVSNREIHFKRVDGSTFWGMTDFVVNTEDDDIFVDGVIIDITDMKKLSQDLASTNQNLTKINSELDQLVYRTSHDLRTPISSLLGIHNLLDVMIDQPEQKELLGMMNTQLHRLDRIIMDIISYRKISQLGLTNSEIAIDKMVHKILSSIQFMDNYDQIDIRVSIDEQVTLVSDQHNVEIVFNNLISNAIKYSKKDIDDAYLVIDGHVDEKEAIIKVAENGIGIDKSVQEKVFDMFYRATNHSTGTGLGLFIVKEALSKLDGTIELDSQPNQGSTFTVRIPNLISA